MFKASTADGLGGSCSSPRPPREGTQGKASEGSGCLWLKGQIRPQALAAQDGRCSLLGSELALAAGGTWEPQQAGGTGEGPGWWPCGCAFLSWAQLLEQEDT